MSEEINNGGPAFPLGTIDGYVNSGMSLRDWFAGMALQGVLQKVDFEKRIHPGDIVAAAFEFADNMLKAGAEK